MECLCENKRNQKKEGAGMTTLGKLRISPWLIIRTLTDKIGKNGCAVPVFQTGNNSVRKTNADSHQTTLIEYMSKEVIE